MGLVTDTQRTCYVVMYYDHMDHKDTQPVAVFENKDEASLWMAQAYLEDEEREDDAAEAELSQADSVIDAVEDPYGVGYEYSVVEAQLDPC